MSEIKEKRKKEIKTNITAKQILDAAKLVREAKGIPEYMWQQDFGWIIYKGKIPSKKAAKFLKKLLDKA